MGLPAIARASFAHNSRRKAVAKGAISSTSIMPHQPAIPAPLPEIIAVAVQTIITIMQQIPAYNAISLQIQLPAVFVPAMPLGTLLASSVPKPKASFCAASASPALF